MAMAGEEEAKERSPTTTTLHGDLLEIVLTHLPTTDLLPASRVSTTWHHAVHSSLRLAPRHLPWLVLHVQTRRSTTTTITTHAFDPHSHSWVRFTDVEAPAMPESDTTFRSSTSSTLLYKLNPSKLAFSSDTFHCTWTEVPGPKVWRMEPVVAAVGNFIIVAGGVCEFEDEPCAVEMFDTKVGESWCLCEPMPDRFRCSASSTWISAAVANGKFHVIERNTGVFCSFDPKTKTWGEPTELSPDPSLFLFAIGSTGDRLVMIGFTGDSTDVTGMRLWEVNCETLELVEVGSMPPEMLNKLVGDIGLTVSSIEIQTAAAVTARGYAYIYNSSYPEEIFFCELSNSCCEWGSTRNPAAVDWNPMDGIVGTCSPVQIDDLRVVLRRTNRK